MQDASKVLVEIVCLHVITEGIGVGKQQLQTTIVDGPTITFSRFHRRIHRHDVTIMKAYIQSFEPSKTVIPIKVNLFQYILETL